MWFAYFLFIYTFILSIGFYATRKKVTQRKNILFLTVFSIPLIILSGLRYPRIGTDTAIYLFFFEETFNGGSAIYEPGFNLLLKIISLITHNGQIMLIMVNIIIFTLLFRFILKYSNCIWLSVFLFIGMEIFDQSMNLIRQILALSIIVNSIDYLLKRQYYKFSLIVLLASTFHFSALVFFVAPIIDKIRLTTLKIFTFYICIILISVLSSIIITLILTKLGIYGAYLNNDNFGVVDQPKIACILHLLINILLFSFCYLFGWKKTESKTNRLMTKLLMVGGVFWAMSLNFSTAGRAALYFDIYSIVLIPNILFSLKIKRNKWIISTAILILFTFKYFIIAYLRPEWFAIYPYKFYFES